MAGDIGKILADSFGHLQIFIDEEVGWFGPTLTHMYQGTVCSALVRFVTATQLLNFLENKLEALFRIKHLGSRPAILTKVLSLHSKHLVYGAP